MQQWPEHSLYGYFTRLPTNKLERILEAQDQPAADNILQPRDYLFIRRILKARQETALFQKKCSQDGEL